MGKQPRSTGMQYTIPPLCNARRRPCNTASLTIGTRLGHGAAVTGLDAYDTSADFPAAVDAMAVTLYWTPHRMPDGAKFRVLCATAPQKSLSPLPCHFSVQRKLKAGCTDHT